MLRIPVAQPLFTSGGGTERANWVRSILYRVPIDNARTQLYFVHFYPSERRSFHTLKRETKLGEYVALGERLVGGST